MIVNPRVGQRVQLWYAEKKRAIAPHHGKLADVVVSGRGKPRNHLVRLDDGVRVVVPCGNLRSVKR